MGTCVHRIGSSLLKLTLTVASAVALASAQVVSTTVPLSLPPIGIAVNPVTNKVYIALTPSSGTGSVTVLDGATNTVTSVPAGMGPNHLAIDTVSNKVYCTNTNSQITVLDGATNTTKAIPLSAPPLFIAVNEKTHRVYVSYSDIPAIDVINETTNKVIDSLSVGAYPAKMVVDSAANRIYGIDPALDSILGIDSSTGASRLIATAGSSPADLAVNSVTRRLYVLDANTYNQSPAVANHSTIAVVDESDDKLLTTRYAGHTGQAGVIAVNSTLNQIYAANYQDADLNLASSLTVLDGKTLDTLSSPAIILSGTGETFQPAHIAVNTATNQVIISGMQENQLRVVNSNSFEAAALPSGGPATDDSSMFTINPLTNIIYIANNSAADGSNVAVLDGSGGTNSNATVFPEALQFSASLNASSAPQILYLGNTGGVPMSIQNLEFNSLFASAISQQNNCADPLPAHTTCPVALTFTPQVPTADQNGSYEIVTAPVATVTSVPITATFFRLPTTINGVPYTVEIVAGQSVSFSVGVNGAGATPPTGTVNVSTPGFNLTSPLIPDPPGGGYVTFQTMPLETTGEIGGPCTYSGDAQYLPSTLNFCVNIRIDPPSRCGGPPTSC